MRLILLFRLPFPAVLLLLLCTAHLPRLCISTTIVSGWQQVKTARCLDESLASSVTTSSGGAAVVAAVNHRQRREVVLPKVRLGVVTKARQLLLSNKERVAPLIINFMMSVFKRDWIQETRCFFERLSVGYDDD